MISNIQKVSQMNEIDPTGRAPSDPGSKLDRGKPRLDLVLGDFSKALIEVGKVGTFGANKYSDGGWKVVPNGIARYSDAGLRHYFYRKVGEDYDPDSNLLHAAHAAWNALAVLQFILEGKKDNDDN